MNLIAIASINKDADVVGARLLGTTDLKVRDCTLEQIENILKEGNTIRNLTLEKGKVTWSQGASSRYTTLESSNMHVVDNINSIIVIGSYEKDKSTTEYIVANCNGKLVPLSEERLIEYGKQYTLANCKVTTKDNKSYVASISGELDKLLGEVKFDYNTDTRVITANLPFIWSTKLIIPYTINGNTILTPQTIQIIPEMLSDKIIHLVLPKSVKEIRANLFKDLPKLRTLECEGSMSEILTNSFCYCKGITDIYIGNINDRTHEVFQNLRHLQNIKFGVKPTVIGENTFKNCDRANISDMIYEGVFSIEKEALRGCTQLVDITLPKSLKRLGSSAFRFCTNIETLRINDSSLRIEPDRFGDRGDREAKRKNEGILVKLLEDSPNATLYCPYSFPQSTIDECVASHVKVIRDRPTKEDKALTNTQAKATILGVSIRKSDLAKTPQEVLGFMTIVGDAEWREGLMAYIKNAIKNHSYGNQIYTIGYKGAHLQIGMGSTGLGRDWDKTIKQAKVGKNYMYILGAYGLVAYLIDRTLLKEQVAKHIKNGNGSLIGVGKALQSGVAGGAFTLRIPSFDKRIKYTEVSRIYEEGDNLILQYKNKAMASEIILQGVLN